MSITQEIGTRFLFETKTYSPLTFSLLQTQYKFDLLSNFDPKHISLNSQIGKFNTTWHTFLLSIGEEELHILWTRKNTFEPFLSIVNYDIFMTILQIGFRHKKTNEMFSFLTTLKSDNTFKITKNWTCYKKLHPDIAKNYITLIKATKLNQIFSHILHFFDQSTHKSVAMPVASSTLKPSVNQPAQNPLTSTLKPSVNQQAQNPLTSTLKVPTFNHSVQNPPQYHFQQTFQNQHSSHYQQNFPNLQKHYQPVHQQAHYQQTHKTNYTNNYPNQYQQSHPHNYQVQNYQNQNYQNQNYHNLNYQDASNHNDNNKRRRFNQYFLTNHYFFSKHSFFFRINTVQSKPINRYTINRYCLRFFSKIGVKNTTKHKKFYKPLRFLKKISVTIYKS